MCAILQLVLVPLNPTPIAEHFRRSHPQFEHSFLSMKGHAFNFYLFRRPFIHCLYSIYARKNYATVEIHLKR